MYSEGSLMVFARLAYVCALVKRLAGVRASSASSAERGGAGESAEAGEGGAVGMGAAAESAFAPESGCGCADGGVNGFFWCCHSVDGLCGEEVEGEG